MGCSAESAKNADGQVDLQSAKIDLYWNMFSQPSRAVKSLLDAGNVKYSDHHLDLFKGEHKQPDILKINPAGQVPFVVINGEVCTESAATLRLLASVVKPLNVYYPNNAFTR